MVRGGGGLEMGRWEGVGKGESCVILGFGGGAWIEDHTQSDARRILSPRLMK